MKKSLFLGMAAMAALVFTGCQKDVVLNEVPQDQPIAFGTYLGRDAQTKGVVLDNTTLPNTGFGVFASYTGQSNWNAGVNTINFMNNQKVEGHIDNSTTTWTYSPLKYWPKTSGDKISFFAYAPHFESSSALSIVTTQTGCPKIKYTVSETISNHKDLVFAPAHLNESKTTNSGVVNFNFFHALSRVDFKVKSTFDIPDTKTRIIITGLRFLGNFYKTAELNLELSNGTPSNGAVKANSNPSWANHTIMTSPETGFDLCNSTLHPSGIQSTTDFSIVKQDSSTDSGYLMLIPQSFAAGGLSIEIDYNIVTEDTNFDNGTTVIPQTYTYKNDSQQSFEAGKAYSFEITISLNAIQFTANVENWDVQTSTPLSL